MQISLQGKHKLAFHWHELPVSRAGSDGRCNTIWYKAAFRGGVYEIRETVWAFRGAEVRHVATLEGGADAACAFGKEHSSICGLMSRHAGIVPAVRRRALLALTQRQREGISRGGSGVTHYFRIGLHLPN